jgi:malonyl-CoA/methylmalonyl-CoA synthetase
MRLFISGSAPLLEETHRAFEARTGHVILERYGMTETGMNTSNPLEGERRAGTVGFPLPEVEVRVADEDGRALGPGEVGVLEVRGPNVFKGYWGLPEKTADEFRPDGFFITGDIAAIDEAGYVRIVGRAKDLIISGGFNVYPKEVELVIDELEGVAESAVIGLAHPDFGEAVTAVVRRETGREGPDEAAVIGAVKEQLANYKGAQAGLLRGRAAAQRHGQGAEERAQGKLRIQLFRLRVKDSLSLPAPRRFRRPRPARPAPPGTAA